MKTEKSFFQFPFVIVSREKYHRLIVTGSRVQQLEHDLKDAEVSKAIFYNMLADSFKDAANLRAELADLNIKRNVKGQFERRAKCIQ